MLDSANSLELLHGQGERPLVFLCDGGEVCHDLAITILRDQPLGCLGHADQKDSEEADDENEAATGEMEITPTPVVVPGAFRNSCIRSAGVIAHESPGEEPGDCIADRPPNSHEGHQPVMACREKFDQVRGIEDVISSSTGRINGYPTESQVSGSQEGQMENTHGAEGDITRHAPSNENKRSTDEQTGVERHAATDDVRTEAPECSTNQEADLRSERYTSNVFARVAKLLCDCRLRDRLADNKKLPIVSISACVLEKAKKLDRNLLSQQHNRSR